MPELGVTPGVVSAEALLQIDGEDQPALNGALLSLIVEETTEGLYRCEARFGNWGSGGAQPDFLYFDRSLLDFGKEIIVRLGSGEGEGQVFKGRISALEAQFSTDQPPSITVLAEDRLMDLRMTRRTRAFEDVSDADIFEQIARDHGLQPEIDLSGGTYRVVAQVNQSDLAFLRERARRSDAEVWVDGETLVAKSRPQRAQDGEADLRLTFGQGLLEFSVLADLAHQHTSVVVSGWDVAAKDALTHEAEDSILGAELDGGVSGASVLQETFGVRVDRIVHQHPLTSVEAQTLAEAAFRAQARRFICGTGLARGDARLRVGAQVRIDEVGALFSGNYIVTEVRHIFSRGAGGGYTTEFRVERAGLGQP